MIVDFKFVLFSTSQRELKTEYFLWQSFNVEKAIERTRAELKVDDENLRELATAQENLECEMRERKMEQAIYTKDSFLCEKMMAKKKAELDKKVPETFTRSIVVDSLTRKSIS